MNDVTSQSALLFSVVVCTYNRADLLKRAIQSLCEQTLPPSLYEVIVIDNNSTDRTSAVVNEFSTQFALRYEVEPQQGLSHARNHGWKIAHGHYVAYLDDDGYVPPHWLSLARDVMRSHNPMIMGGPIRDYFTTKRPDWFLDDYLLGNWVSSRERGAVPKGEWLFGGNLFLERKVLEDVDGFSTALGMKGDQLAYAEELLVIDKARAINPDALVFFEPDLFIYHLVRPEKTSLKWMMRSSYSRGRSATRHQYLFYGKEPSWNMRFIAIKSLILNTGLTVTKLALSPILWRHSRYREYPNLKSYAVDLTLIFLSGAGNSVETLEFRL
ncbi:MAG: glycosyltransferase family 2 protein [Anaerolineae bacterium]